MEVSSVSMTASTKNLRGPDGRGFDARWFLDSRLLPTFSSARPTEVAGLEIEDSSGLASKPGTSGDTGVAGATGSKVLVTEALVSAELSPDSVVAVADNDDEFVEDADSSDPAATIEPSSKSTAADTISSAVSWSFEITVTAEAAPVSFSAWSLSAETSLAAGPNSKVST